MSAMIRCGAIAFVVCCGLAFPMHASGQAKGPNGQNSLEQRAAETPATPSDKRGAAETKPPQPGGKQGTGPKPGGTPATVVDLQTIEGVMGKNVRSRAGNEDMGRIVDVLVNTSGQIRAAVIDFGGFLGVGSRKVAVAWKTLDFADSIGSGSVKVTLTKDQVRLSPEYKQGEPVVILEGTIPPKAANETPPSRHNQDAPPR